MNEDHTEHERLVRELNDPVLRREYARPFDSYHPSFVPSLLGWLLVASGNLVYGARPSYGKFRAIEVVARIPYQSWESAAYTLLSGFFGNEKHAVRLCKTTAFSRFAQDNETMHVVVISHLARTQKNIGWFRHTLLPILFSLFYFWAIYILYLVSHRAALELNYLFESHAYQQYSRFLEENEEELKHKPMMSDFLAFYGREAKSEYEFFEMVRNDELIHRNRSLKEFGYCGA
jgi:ubiquinol oxidase